MSKVSELIAEWREAGPVAWAESPYGWIDIDGEPIRLEAWQRAVLVAWWTHRDALTTLGLSHIKKAGKTASNSVLLCWRWLALPGEHFAVGNDFDQSAGRQFAMIADMIRRHPYLRRNVKAGKSELVFEPTGSTIKALAVDAAGNAGANHLTASHTEAWGIVYEAGVRAFEELTPPPGKVYGLPALRICDSYAGYEGESSTWHGIVDRGLAGERIDDDWPIYRNGGLLLFHMAGEEAQARCFRGTPEEAAAYYADQRVQLRQTAFRRMHLNERTEDEEAFITAAQYDACVDHRLAPLLPNSRIALFGGLDLATKHDNAAAIFVYFDDDTNQIVTALHRVWKPTTGHPVDLSEVEAYLLKLVDDYYVGVVDYDPYQAVYLADRLRSHLPLDEFPQTPQNLSYAASLLFSLVTHRRIRVYPDDELRRHVLAARAKMIGTDDNAYRLSKRVGKIDLAAALSFACAACWRNNAPQADPAEMAAQAEAERQKIEHGRALVTYVSRRTGEVYVRDVGSIVGGWQGWVDLQRARQLIVLAPGDWRIEQEEIT
ncbi:MAG TPA: hypothetical protein VJ793_05695 [Anaerolineae bacterium]|nr:hypothetical protein [Anaerolineae bacterium]